MSPSLPLNITSIQFALHSDVTLRITLHRSISVNPHQVANQLLALPDNSNSEKFAILDAKRIISMNQIATAANSALLRRYQYQQKYRSDNSTTTSGRGLALETILCCAGSTNTGSVLRDYAFDKHSTAAKDLAEGREGIETYDIILVGFCSSDEEYLKILTDLKMGDAEPTNQMQAFFSRARTDKEMQDLMKVYKITKEEVEMVGSSLEKAINNRVAAKFYV